MIVDTSVLMAILREEDDAAPLAEALWTAGNVRMSAGTWIELAAVTSGKGDEHLPRLLDRLVEALQIRIAPVSVEQAQIGHDAYRRFGKGQHKARLNLGDCFSYALAKAINEPLLFKGEDFIHTDVTPAI